MKCPTCASKLRCYDSRPIHDSKRVRWYICLGCAGRFLSEENLDPEPIEKKGVPKFITNHINNYG